MKFTRTNITTQLAGYDLHNLAEQLHVEWVQLFQLAMGRRSDEQTYRSVVAWMEQRLNQLNQKLAQK